MIARITTIIFLFITITTIAAFSQDQMQGAWIFSPYYFNEAEEDGTFTYEFAPGENDQIIIDFAQDGRAFFYAPEYNEREEIEITWFDAEDDAIGFDIKLDGEVTRFFVRIYPDQDEEGIFEALNPFESNELVAGRVHREAPQGR